MSYFIDLFVFYCHFSNASKTPHVDKNAWGLIPTKYQRLCNSTKSNTKAGIKQNKIIKTALHNLEGHSEKKTFSTGT